MLRLIAAAFLTSVLSVSAATYVDKATKLRFPDKLGAWERDHVHHYDDPSAGTSIDYRHPMAGVATFYIYNGGLKKIPSGGKSDTVTRIRWGAGPD